VSALFKTFKYERGKGVGLTWGKLVRTDTVSQVSFYSQEGKVSRRSSQMLQILHNEVALKYRMIAVSEWDGVIEESARSCE